MGWTTVKNLKLNCIPTSDPRGGGVVVGGVTDCSQASEAQLQSTPTSHGGG